MEMIGGRNVRSEWRVIAVLEPGLTLSYGPLGMEKTPVESWRVRISSSGIETNE